MERRVFAAALVLAMSMLWADKSVRADLVDPPRPGTADSMSVRQIVGAGLGLSLSAASKENQPPAGGLRSFDHDGTPTGLSRESAAPAGVDAEVEGLQLAFEAPAGGEIKLFARPNFSPLVDAAGPDGGILSIIMTRALENAGYEPSLGFADEEGDAEDLRGVNFPYPRDPAKEASYLYSVPIVTMQAVASVRGDAELRIDGVADLAGLRVCSDEAMLAQALHAAEQAGVVGVDGVAKRIVACFDDLLDGDLDVVLADPELSASVTATPEIESLLTTSDRPLDLGALHAIMPRFSTYSSSMMYHLNNALTEMIRSGEVDSIVSEARAARVARVATEGLPFLAPRPVQAIAPSEPSATEPAPSRSEPLSGATM